MVDISALSTEAALADHLVAAVLEASSGASSQECVGNLPRDTYFIGNLRNEDPHSPQPSRINAELLGKLSPTACGLEIKVQVEASVAAIDVDAKWAVYYRVMPDRSEQLRYQTGLSEGVEVSAEAEPGDEDESGQVVLLDEEGVTPGDGPDTPTPPTTGRRRSSSESLLPKWRKIPCAASAPVALSFDGSGWTADTQALDRVGMITSSGPTVIIRTGPTPDR